MTRPATRIGVLSLMVFALVATLFDNPLRSNWYFEPLHSALGAGIGQTFLGWFMVPGIAVEWFMFVQQPGGCFLQLLDPDTLVCF